MTLQQLKYVIKVVECGSITEAARALFIAQPSLSAAIKDLEAEFGIQIFNRTARGITLSADGKEFLAYARQVTEQAELMQTRYAGGVPRRLCSISTQHYAFAVNAFVALIQTLNPNEYEFTLRETRTHEIIEDVANLQSELGILYLSNFNQQVLTGLFKEKQLVFTPLFEATPHVFISAAHPLAGQKSITVEQLADYPRLEFEQGTNNSFYFAEELLSTEACKKRIKVSDRATLFNLVIGLNGYTICSGVLNSNLNGKDIVAVPLCLDERMLVGYITNKKSPLSACARAYLSELKRLIQQEGFALY